MQADQRTSACNDNFSTHSDAFCGEAQDADENMMESREASPWYIDSTEKATETVARRPSL